VKLPSAAAAALALVAAAGLSAVGCSLLPVPVDRGAGSVVLELSRALAGGSRTVGADFRRQVDEVRVIVTGGDGLDRTTSVVDADDGSADGYLTTPSVTVPNVAAGPCSIAVLAFRAGVQIGYGGASAVLAANATATVAVTVEFDTGIGLGGFALTVAWPKSVGAYAEALLDGTTTLIDASITADAVNYYADFAATGLAAGAHELALTFYEDAGKTIVVGYAREALNVWRGLTSDRWIDGDGNLQATRGFAADELFDSTVVLGDLEIAGLEAPFVFAPGAANQFAGLAAGERIGVRAVRAVAGQSFAYTWNGTPPVEMANSAAYDLDLSGAALDGANSLIITVTAPNKSGSRMYTITVRKAYPVSFDLNDGTPAAGETIPVQLVAKGGHAAAPAAPTRATGFAFGGWYAAADFSGAAWNFAADTVAGPLTLYAKWTGTAGIGVGVTNPTYLGLSFADYDIAIYQGASVSFQTNRPELAAVTTGWTWRLDGALQAATSSLFTLDAAATSGLLGDHYIDARVVHNGVGYAATVKLSVAAPLRFTGALSANLAELAAWTSGVGDPVAVDLSEAIFVGGVIPSHAFDGSKRIASLVLPSGITAIGDYAFLGCTFNTITIPPTVTSLGTSIFLNCNGLRSVDFPASVTTIPSQTFGWSHTLIHFTAPATIKTLGNGAFTYEYDLTDVHLPAGLVSIGVGCFFGCASLTAVYLEGTSPPTLFTGGSPAFGGNAAGRKIYVPYSADHSVLNAYKAAAGWSDYAADIEEWTP
jgi:uncharacterized repeat protein (TIGR02543 family)